MSVFSLLVLYGQEGVVSIGGASTVGEKKLDMEKEDKNMKEDLKRDNTSDAERAIATEQKEIKHQETRRQENL